MRFFSLVQNVVMITGQVNGRMSQTLPNIRNLWIKVDGRENMLCTDARRGLIFRSNVNNWKSKEKENFFPNLKKTGDKMRRKSGIITQFIFL